MKRTMIRRKSLFDGLPDNIEPKLPDIEERPIEMEKAKKAYPNI